MNQSIESNLDVSTCPSLTQWTENGGGGEVRVREGIDGQGGIGCRED